MATSRICDINEIAKFKDNFVYVEETGQLFWAKPAQGRRMDRECGSAWDVKRPTKSGDTHSQRYRVVNLHGKRYKVHNVIWQMHHGPIPEGHWVDHKDGDGFNNKMDNLRLISAKDNAKNMAIPVSNTSGIVGVIWDEKRQKWEARITHRGKAYYLGQFYDKGDALAARKKAEKQCGFYKRHGRTVMPNREKLKFFHMP